MYSVRRGTHHDADWVAEQAAAFQRFALGSALPVNPEHLQRVVHTFLAVHHILIVEKDGERCGFVAALVQPHFLNPDITVLTEIAWWVVPEQRHTRAGLLLLNALDSLADELGVELSVLSVEANSPLTGRALQKRGYKIQEISLMRKV